MVFFAERLSDGDVRDAGYDDDIAAVCLFHAHPGQSLVDEDLRCLLRALVALIVTDDDAFLRAQRSLVNASDAKASDVFIVSEGRDLHLQRLLIQVRISVAVFQDRFEQRFDAVAWRIHVILDDAVARNAVEDREIQLLIGGVQVQEQLIDFIDDFLCALILFIDLVDEQDRTQAEFQRLAEDETGLGHRPFAGIDEQDDRIDRLDDALDLAGEIGMSWGVHDVDLDALVDDGTVLGVDGDAAFTFQVVAVHDAVHDLFIGTEYIALAQECVHQRGFSSVDMGDDGYIDDLFFFVHYAFTSLQTYIII